MKTIKLIFIILVLSPLLVNSGSPFFFNQIPEGISIAIKAGNSKELAKFFNSTIELTILNKEDVYSKSQAELIVKDFFKKYSPENFIILHRGGKEVTKYAIGNLTTTNGIFRVYFLLKTENEIPLIHQLRIEEEDHDEQ